MRVLRVAGAHFRPGIEAGRVRCILHVSNRAAQRARAVEGALRAAQNLDAIQVLQTHVEIQRCVIDVGRHRRHDRRCQTQLARGAFAVQATNDQSRAVDAAEWTLVGEIDSGHRMRECGHVLDAGCLQIGARDRGNTDRQILRGYFAPRRCHDDFLQRETLILGIRVCLNVCAVDRRHHRRSQRRDFLDATRSTAWIDCYGSSRALRCRHDCSLLCSLNHRRRVAPSTPQLCDANTHSGVGKLIFYNSLLSKNGSKS